MRGTVAKQLRKEARMYFKVAPDKEIYFDTFVGKTDSNGKPVVDRRTTITCEGYRKEY